MMYFGCVSKVCCGAEAGSQQEEHVHRKMLSKKGVRERDFLQNKKKKSQTKSLLHKIHVIFRLFI